MREVAEAGLPNSLMMLMDPSTAELPQSIDGALVAATPSCVVVGTLAQLDGPTRFVLTDESVPTSSNLLIFAGELETPARKIAVCTVLGEVVLQISVEHQRTTVKIWANDVVEPSEIVVLVVRSSA